MRSMRLAAILSLAAGCASGPPAADAPRTGPDGPGSERALPIPADLASHIKASIELGRTLYLIDRASAIGTDVMRENVPDPPARGVDGYLTFRNGDAGKLLDSFGVLFMTGEEPFRILFRIDVPHKGKPTFTALSPPKDLDDLGTRMFRARRLALAVVPRAGRPFNSVVLPGDAVGRPDSILVYLLAAERRAGEMVFGIHYRVLVSEDGKTITELLPLSKSALVVPPPGDSLPPGDVLVATVVSHIVTDWPLETHVFVSLAHKRQPIYVATQRGTWLVIGDRILLVDDKPPQAR